MGYTLAEKVLARTSGRDHVRAGDEIEARPDFVIAYDFPGYTDVIFRQMRDDFGIERVDDASRFAIFIDHMVPTATPKEEELHQMTRAWCAEQGAALYERHGIGHQVSAEVGYAVPGGFAVHFDGHVSQLGAFGSLAIGLRRNLLEAFVRPAISIRVPETVRIDLTGSLRPGVMARDVFHHLVRALGPKFAAFKVLELGGPAVAEMSIESRQTICGLAMFTGATTAVMMPDDKTADWLGDRPKLALDPVFSDDDAVYAARHTVDLSALEPVVVLPPTPSNTRDLSEVIGTEVQAGYLGSCASGRIEDLRAAAQVLKGRQIAPGFALHVVPTSRALMAQAAAEGLITTLVEAGAFVSSPSCDYCFGRIATMAEGQRAVSTGTLNVPGRMGHPKSEIFLCNAAAVAAAAIEGRIADPRRYL
ncbi:aconitase family protein [Tistrella mobilis]|uniref:3-isopropylmalate dehydratase large subunit n=1 Tax=Tistrella mobilis TaxID=171437 RepID=UPI0031F62B6F